MQYLEGETLAGRIEQGTSHKSQSPSHNGLPLEEALSVAIQIAGALDAAHRAGIVDRDLKPGNIMLVRRGGPSGPPDARLLDFGLAKVATPAVAVTASMAPTTPPSMTAQGTLLGTFQYMAPEQIEGLEADARTDIFAFGAVLFEMLTGRPAFEGKTRASLLGAILKDDPPPTSKIRPGVPAALDRVVTTCLAKEPDDRWQTARDLQRELKWMAEGTVGDDRTTAAQGAGSAGAGRRVLPWAFAGACGVALVVVLALWAPWQAEAPAATMRFAVVPPAAQPFAFSAGDRELAISPNGARLVYVAGGGAGGLPQRLFVRALDRLEAEPLGVTAKTPAGPSSRPTGDGSGFSRAAAARNSRKCRLVADRRLGCATAASIHGARAGVPTTRLYLRPAM